MFYFPFVLAVVVVFVLAGAILLAVIQIGVIDYAFTKIGVPAHTMLGLLLLSIAGSLVNIPVGRLPQRQVEPPGVVTYFGITYRVPGFVNQRQTVVAVNLGGALVPLGLSLYLAITVGNITAMLGGVLVVAAVTYSLARPIKGVGIAVPTLAAPIVAAIYALLTGVAEPAAVAYVAGTMGTLLGADILNLPRIRDLGAPVVSIGGAGTFDGIFITGIIAVLLASW